MTTRKIKRWLVAIALLPVTAAVAQKKTAPNIVFIFSDDHAYQAISAYKSAIAKLAPTPNIDRIAKEGMLFNKCYVTNSLCTPSRATILTGTHSHINGVKNLSDQLSPQLTFPQLLQQAGYQTAVVGKWHLKSDPVGFDYWDILINQGQYYNPDFVSASGKKTVTGYATDITTDKSIAWLEQRKKDKPFLMMIHHKAPHRPWEKGPSRLSLYEDVTFPEPATLFDDYSGRGTPAKNQEMSIDKNMTLRSDLKIHTQLQDDKLFARLNPEQLSAVKKIYDPITTQFLAMNLTGDALVKWKYQRFMRDYLTTVRSVDDNVGRVLDYLDKNKLSENTLVVYCSDQGFYLGEHGWFDKRFMYEESFRTPLLMKWPKVIKKGTVNNDLVSNLDFAQTFLEMAGAKSPDRMQGLSLLPVMKGQTPANWRKSLYYHYYDHPAEHNVPKHEGVATKQYKLINFYELGEWELYDLLKDPHEMRNEYANPAYAEVVKNMKLELAKLKTQYKAN